jgi:alanine-glyoxylate transaminase / serine-glyoxylate transaminase / serine-pyruvate transaminase
MTLARLLMGSGPSNPSPEVLEALGRPMLGLLDPEFVAILEEVSERLRLVFRTSNRMTFAVSGTGSAGMEAALVNLLEPGDEAIVCSNGVFGGRMTDVASRAGATVVAVEAAWGSPIDIAAVRDALSAHPDAKVFAMVHAETSTGVAQPIEEIAAAVRDHGALLVLDTVTSLGGMSVDIDDWGVDVAYSGTQKCLSVPPGLSPITFSDRALEKVTARRTPVQSWYLDVTLLQAYWGPSEGARVYHHTPPISMIRALHAGLGRLLDEGLEAAWERHRATAELLTAGLLGRGFSYVADEGHRLPMLHCVRVPDGVDEAEGRAKLLSAFGIEVASGIGRFKGECWRIGLMGYNCAERNVLTLLAAIDDVIT